MDTRLRFSQIAVAAVILAAGFTSAGPAGAASPPPDIPPDQVVVKLRPAAQIAAVSARYGASVLDVMTETNLYLLQLPVGASAEALLPTLNADADLFYAEPNYYSDARPGGSQRYFGARGMFPGSGQRYFAARGNPTPGSAPLDDWLWKKIGLPQARAASSGQGVVVAVVDTGVDLDHPMLVGALVAGYDFVGMDNEPYDRGDGLDNNGDGYVDEGTGHGTHVAGIILTEAPGVKIMPVRVLNSDGVGTYWEVAAGIRYAVDHGAQVVNLSLSAPRLTPSLADALSYAVGRGVVVVAAAGDGPGPNYPAAFDGAGLYTVIGTGATDMDDFVAAFSGGQPSDTDVYAPGVNIYSAFANGSYAVGSGTSMSAAVVSGEAALLIARHPGWDARKVSDQIVKRIVDTRPADKYGNLQNPPGRVDLDAAFSPSNNIK